MTPQNIKITPESQGLRLDKFLVEQMPETSRTQIQKSIKEGFVLINDKKATVHQFLKDGDIIKITDKPIEDAKKTSAQDSKKEKTFQKDPRALFKKIEVIEDADDFLIINKPTGLLVHPTSKNETNTLADWIIETYPKLRQLGDDPQRPAIVHRLDKDVSGIMLIPKNQDSFDYFKKQFQLRELTKKYTALVYGEIFKDEDEITFPIGRSKNAAGLFVARPHGQDESDKNAHTKFNIIKRFKNYTLLEVQILTGRTHQIRVHLLAYGHSIVGDPLYFKRAMGDKKAEINRIFLHANYLSFKGPDGKEYEFESPLPPALKNFLKDLKPRA